MNEFLKECDRRSAGPLRAAGSRCAKASLGLIAAALLASQTGCGSAESALMHAPVFEVKGKVIKADGKPLSRGKVVFVPTEATGIQASGDIQSDGTFGLKTRGTDDGAVEGKYLVRIEPDFEDVRRAQGPRNLAFPYKYTDEDSSGLSVTVKAEPNQLEPFVLK